MIWFFSDWVDSIIVNLYFVPSISVMFRQVVYSFLFRFIFVLKPLLKKKKRINNHRKVLFFSSSTSVALYSLSLLPVSLFLSFIWFTDSPSLSL